MPDVVSDQTQNSHIPELDSLAVDTLIRLRWISVLGQVGTVFVAWYWCDVAIPWGAVLLFISITALTNILLVSLRRAEWRRGTEAVPHVMAWDTLLLAGLLYWTGGAQNPFSLFLLLNSVLAALTLGRLSAWLLMLVGFSTLLLLTEHHHPLLLRTGDALPASLWIKGRVVAFFLISVTLIYLVQRLRGKLRGEIHERRSTQERLAEERRFHAVATLAAGAAHEMGTPLSTIAVVSREIEIELERDDPDDELTGMARTIRAEVERCQQILARLRPDQANAPSQTFSLGELEALLLESLPENDKIRLRFEWPSEQQIRLPREALREALSNLIRNALQASLEDKPVEVSASSTEGIIKFRVRDHGPGIAESIRRHLGEPFVTTKDPGKGLGLGLHLVKLLAHQLGGKLTISKALGGGESFILSLPERK